MGLLTRSHKEVNNLIEEFVNNYDEVLNKLSETDKNFLIIAKEFGLSYSLLRKLNIHPNEYERKVKKLLALRLIQRLDSKYKEHWIQRNKLLLGKSYKTLISSIYHRNKLKVYVLTEKGKEVLDKLLKFSNEEDFILYNKLKELKERIELEVSKRLQQQKAIEEENKKKLLETKKKQEEKLNEKLRKAIELIKSLEIKESDSELIRTCYELVKLKGNKSAVIEEKDKKIEITKTEVRLELAEKFLINFYELAQKGSKLTAIRKNEFVFVNRRTIALVFDKEFNLLPVIFKFYIKEKEVMQNE